jgi:hypothetical protein
MAVDHDTETPAKAAAYLRIQATALLSARDKIATGLAQMADVENAAVQMHYAAKALRFAADQIEPFVQMPTAEPSRPPLWPTATEVARDLTYEANTMVVYRNNAAQLIKGDDGEALGHNMDRAVESMRAAARFIAEQPLVATLAPVTHEPTKGDPSVATVLINVAKVALYDFDKLSAATANDNINSWVDSSHDLAAALRAMVEAR